jgi:hypothetical protein
MFAYRCARVHVTNKQQYDKYVALAGRVFGDGLRNVVIVPGIFAHLDVDEQDALVAATRAVGFPVGHASAQMGWRGLLSRPTWRILLYSDQNPPAQRGLVLV